MIMFGRGKKIEEIGSAVRIKDGIGEGDRTICVEFAPILKDGTVSEDEFGVAGGGVGYGVSCFDSKKKAKDFVNDVELHAQKKMSTDDFVKKWPADEIGYDAVEVHEEDREKRLAAYK